MIYTTKQTYILWLKQTADETFKNTSEIRSILVLTMI